MAPVLEFILKQSWHEMSEVVGSFYLQFVIALLHVGSFPAYSSFLLLRATVLFAFQNTLFTIWFSKQCVLTLGPELSSQTIAFSISLRLYFRIYFVSISTSLYNIDILGSPLDADPMYQRFLFRDHHIIAITITSNIKVRIFNCSRKRCLLALNTLLAQLARGQTLQYSLWQGWHERSDSLVANVTRRSMYSVANVTRQSKSGSKACAPHYIFSQTSASWVKSMRTTC